VLRALGRSEESREAFLHLLPPSTRPVSRALTRILGDDTFVRLLFALGSLRTGDPCVGKAELAAHVYAAIGQADDMFTCLRREVLARDPWYLAVEPIYDPYRNDPRFEELLQLSRHASEPPARKSAATDRTF
jgi:hypothetical protein